MHQVPVTSGSSSMHESPVVDSSSSLDVTNTASIFTEASKTTQQVIHQEAGGSGDADGCSVVKGAESGDICCASPLYQPAGLQHAGGGDDIGVSPVTLLSNHTDAQLQELFRQQQWHVRLNQMMQQQAQAPLVIGADTAASLLWHQQQQQHITNPTTVSFAFCSDQVTQQQQQQQQQQVISQQQQQQQQPQMAVEMKYDVQQQQVQAKSATDTQQMQSPRQQKPRLIARGNWNSVAEIKPLNV